MASRRQDLLAGLCGIQAFFAESSVAPARGRSIGSPPFGASRMIARRQHITVRPRQHHRSGDDALETAERGLDVLARLG
jgi:hypothetical protein